MEIRDALCFCNVQTMAGVMGVLLFKLLRLIAVGTVLRESRILQLEESCGWRISDHAGPTIETGSWRVPTISN